MALPDLLRSPLATTELLKSSESIGTPARAPSRSRLEDLIPQLLTSFAAGQAVRQRDPATLSNIILDFVRARDLKQREQRADAAQQLREQREGRLLEAAGTREDRLVRAEEDRNAQTKELNARNQRNDLRALQNEVEDNLRAMFSADRSNDPAAIDAYIAQQSGRVKDFSGDPTSFEAALKAIAQQLSQEPRQVPYLEREPGTPAPATVQRGTIVRNAPAKQKPPKPNAYTTTDEDGVIYRVIEDPGTGKVISKSPVGKRPKSTTKDPLQTIIDEAVGGRGGAPPAAASGRGGRGGEPGGSKRTAAQRGERRTINGQLAEWDGTGWLPVKK